MMKSIHERIVEQYGTGILRKSAMGIRAGAGVFERCMSGKGYRTALEIGTYRGCSTAEIAQYVERVITIDLKYGKLEYNRDTGTDPRDATYDREAFWQSLGIDNIDLILVADDAEKAAVVGALDFAFAFIDGAHDEGVRLDFELTRRCGRVLFHDCDPAGKAPNYVYNFVQSLPGKITQDDIFCLWTP